MAKKLRWSVSAERLAQLSQLSQETPVGSPAVDEPSRPRPENPQVRWVDLEQIQPNPFQPRREMSADGLDDLSSSIQMHGLLQPLVATPNTDGSYTLIAGHRRWAASRQAGLKQAPVLVRSVNEPELQVLALIENIQREDLHVIDKAQAFWRIADQFPTQEKAAEALGVKRDALAQWLRTRDLEAEILTICGTIPNLSLRTLLRLVALPPRQRLTEAKRLAALQSPKPASATTEPPAIPEKPKPMSFQYRDPDPKRKLGIHIEMRPTSRKSAVAVEDYIRALEDVLEKLKQERKREAAKS